MNACLVAAAWLMGLIGLVHSVLGEVLIFRRLRRQSAKPAVSASALPRRQIGILWASWHAVTVFGWALAALLWRVAGQPAAAPVHAPLLHAIAAACGVAALLVLIGTRGRHPGWLGLLGVALLVLLA